MRLSSTIQLPSYLNKSFVVNLNHPTTFLTLTYFIILLLPTIVNTEMTTNANTSNYKPIFENRAELTRNQKHQKNILASKTYISNVNTSNIFDIYSVEFNDKSNKKTYVDPKYGINTPMSKLRIDDATRARIFQDYFTTINKNVNISNIEDDSVITDNFTETAPEELFEMDNVTDQDEFSNETEATTTTIPSQIQATTSVQSTKTRFVDEMEKRAARVSEAQWSCLLDFLERNPHLARSRGYNNSAHGRAESLRSWQEIANVLNAEGSGTSKSPKEWSVYVSNYKSKLKKVVADINSDNSGTGGGPPRRGPLSDLESRFLAILGPGFAQTAPQVSVNPFPDVETQQSSSAADIQEPNIMPRQNNRIEIEIEDEINVAVNNNPVPVSVYADPVPEPNTVLPRSRRQTRYRSLSKSASSRIISILGLFELTVGDVIRSDGRSELVAATLAVKHVNRKNLLPGYKMQLIYNDTKCDPGVGVDRFFHALYTSRETRTVVVLGTACSEVTESIAKIVPYWNIVQIMVLPQQISALLDYLESRKELALGHLNRTCEGRSLAIRLWGQCADILNAVSADCPQKSGLEWRTVSFGSTSPALSDRSEFPLFCRTVAPDSSHNPARIAFIRQFGWDTVTAFSQNEEVYSLAVNELVTQLEDANITCAASITFAESDYKEQLAMLKELDTRIIIGSFSQEMIPKVFCEAYELGMFGAEYAWLLAGAPPKVKTAPCAKAHLAVALEGVVTVTAYKGIVGSGPSFSGLTNAMFRLEMEQAGAHVSQFAPQTYDAVWSIALALNKAEMMWRNQEKSEQNGTLGRKWKYGLSYFDYDRKDMAEEFLNQIGNLSFMGVSGPVSFNGADRIGTSAFYQIQGGRPKIVALYTHGIETQCRQCSKAQWAGGIPAARRVLVLRVDSVWAPARLAVAALAAAGVALALGFLVFNLHYSKRRSIKLSSPRLNNMTLIGCVLVYTAVAMLGVDNSTLPSHIPFSAMCTSRVYILSAGFSLAFGSMFAKTYRVHRIFVSNRSGVCKTKLLQDTPLISLVCALLVIDGMIVTLWAILDPMERHLKNLTVEISPVERSVVYQPQIEVCKSQNTTGWLIALYAYKGLLLLVGVYMAWETRNVKISALNDSKYIGISVYSVVITSASVVVIGTIISERATLAYISITSLILITTTSTLCLLFLPKILAIKRNIEEDPVIQSLGLRLECKTRRFVTDETQELHFRIAIQNKVYKREAAALDKEIARLERLLAEPLSQNSSNSSIPLHRRTELNIVEEEGGHSKERRTPSVSGTLPMLLLSVLPPVIPRASWPSAEACRGRNSVSFSSQPKLNFRKSQPAIDLYNLCLNRREENNGLLNRIKSFFGSRPSSRKASTISIADPTNQSIAAALRMHVGMIAGLVPGNRKHSMVVSCNTLHVPNPEIKLRRESYARSGPIIRVTDDEPCCSNYQPDRRISSATQKYIAEPETKVNFVLPSTHRKSISHQTSTEKIRGSPRFPHRISPTSGNSLTTLENKRKTSADSVFSISAKIPDEQRRFSHQNVSDHESKVAILQSRWKSTEDARPGPSSQQ